MNFPFELSEFQKQSVKAIEDGNHVLVTAHTGSGKTLPAEYGINYFIGRGKKVIYTAPIKALSNQKYHEFKEKFPEISFGILTGDIKFNPEADVLIMTTEILRNTLYLMKTGTTETLDFNIDIENDLGCVVFDEVHYINDHARGKVWEETIILLPKQVQMIMLSATIDRPMKFANWIKDVKAYTRDVIIASTNIRIVPLVHYIWYVAPTKNVKENNILYLIKENANSLKVIKDSTMDFDITKIQNIQKIKKYLNKTRNEVKGIHSLNTLVQMLKRENMLPAICFVFSRKQAENYASLIEKSLVDDHQTQELVDKECKDILRKLPNYNEYIKLPEFVFVLHLLYKGIAVHHSGIAPILREMIELLFSKGYVKLLFATETFAVGINMPTKTVIFTDVSKYDGTEMRILRSHEYTQMAGRAGRRGLDTIGHVIHIANMFDIPYESHYKEMMNGKPQLLSSKFKVSYNIILNLLSQGKSLHDVACYIKKSMLNLDIIEEIEVVNNNLNKIAADYQELEQQRYNTPLDILDSYMDKINKRNLIPRKKQRAFEQDINEMEFENKFLKIDYNKKQNLILKEKEMQKEREYISTLENFCQAKVFATYEIMVNTGFASRDGKPTLNGECAIKVQEAHPFVMCDLLFNTNRFANLTSCDICSVLSCFTNISVNEKYRLSIPQNIETHCEQVIKMIEPLYNKYSDFEMKHQLDTGAEWDLNYDMIYIVKRWYNAKTENECKEIIQTELFEKEIFLGEFIKCILKITNIVNELVNVSKLLCDVHLENKLSLCSENLMKYVVVNQSLYI